MEAYQEDYPPEGTAEYEIRKIADKKVEGLIHLREGKAFPMPKASQVRIENTPCIFGLNIRCF